MSIVAFPSAIALDENGLPKNDKYARFLAQQEFSDYLNELPEWHPYTFGPSDLAEATDRVIARYLQVCKGQHPSQRGVK